MTPGAQWFMLALAVCLILGSTLPARVQHAWVMLTAAAVILVALVLASLGSIA